MSSKRPLLKQTFYVTGSSLLIMALSACGGGGGGGGGGGNNNSSNVGSGNQSVSNRDGIISPTAPITPNAYNRNLFITQAAAAREAGFTGAGVIVGLIDSGVSTSNVALQSVVIKSLTYVDPATNNTSVGDVRGHGTMVAQVIAGQRVGDFSGGTAPSASIVSARIISDTPTSAGTQGYSLTRVNYDVADAGAKILNNSWSMPEWSASDTVTTNNYVNAYQNFVKTRGGLVVFASGNDGEANPTQIATLPTLAPTAQLEKGWLVVSAVDTNNPGKLAAYANACGISMNYCLVAPGTVSVTTASGDMTTVSGTSFAAPQVSGAAALVWQAFPYFSNDLVRQTLLGTATDIGSAGVDSTFGYGLLNAAAAVKGPAKFDWGDVSVSFNGYTSTWSNPISGNGGLTKDGSGTLVLTENATYRGTTNVLGGTLASEKRIASAVNVGRLGALDVRQVGGNVYNQGSVVLRNGVTTFSSNYTQTSDGQLAIVLGSTLNVQGTANVAGNLHVLSVPQGYVTKTQQEVLYAQGGLQGTFNTFTKASGVFLDATVGYNSNQAWLNVQRVNTASVSGIEYTAAASSGAARVEQAFTLLDAQNSASPSPSSVKDSEFLKAAASLQQSPTPQIAQASLESLSGQLPAASRAMTLQAVNVNSRQVSDHIAQLMDAPVSSSWTQNVNYQSSMTGGGFSGVNYSMNGWVMGNDVFLDKNTFIGSSLTRSDTYGSLSRGSEYNSGTVGEASLYGGKMFDAYYVTGRVASGYYDGRQKRTLLLGTNSERVSSDQSGNYFTVGSEVGYRVKGDNWQVTPFVDTQYINLKQDGFKENGASGFGLQAKSQTTDRLQAGMGIRAGYGWDMGDKGRVNLTAKTHYQRAVAQSNERYSASFTGVNQYMPLRGAELPRDVMMVGSGFEWLLNDQMMLNLLYEQYFSDAQNVNSVNMGFTFTF
ncbi:serine protease [Leminorella grimontii]|uniref:Serine protease n=1 Tax=Leminorella grimontii TaxID=82981 RepID=A0AAV5N5Z3_9GAMM|nr:S8 family serine peptidase [Leminorella grimontii]KFC92764.1 serine protease [Leminorella grimontii ATCC 33999 = DSM 5078]GKX57540.1 serine protease [Leminorella grimontii]VFS62377.1 Extracellular serine protease precursor [Leminorella grimontii]